ncbi:hypothetical protein OIU77_000023 [Salix suchowensis]|uniref:Citrate transporter-like domain-containing protein n=1 Tax=Salix suchowensis TaxID=1278906 RepID=A0ABQ9B6P0_9ROSI|nr:hypothetical protein OIU77_000023 [Salix suchowensis]
MVIFQLISPAQAYASIDLSILGLLFGTIVVSVYLERADAFIYLSKLLSCKSLGAKDLVCRVCLLSAISSAFFTNDTSCMILTEFVLQVAKQHNLPASTFLACSCLKFKYRVISISNRQPSKPGCCCKWPDSFFDFLCWNCTCGSCRSFCECCNYHMHVLERIILSS